MEKQRERQQLMKRGRGRDRGGMGHGGVGRVWSDETDTPPMELKQAPPREKEEESGWDGGWDATMNPDPVSCLLQCSVK